MPYLTPKFETVGNFRDLQADVEVGDNEVASRDVLVFCPVFDSLGREHSYIHKWGS